METYNSYLHDCSIRGPQSMHVAIAKRWRFCPFCGGQLTSESAVPGNPETQDLLDALLILAAAEDRSSGFDRDVCRSAREHLERQLVFVTRGAAVISQKPATT